MVNSSVLARTVAAILLLGVGCYGQEEIEFFTKIGGPKVTVTKDASFHEVIRVDMPKSALQIPMEVGQDFFMTCEWMDLLGDRHPALVVYSGWGAGSIRSRVFEISDSGFRCVFDYKGRSRVRFMYLTDTSKRAAEVEEEGKKKVWTYAKDQNGWHILPQGK